MKMRKITALGLAAVVAASMVPATAMAEETGSVYYLNFKPEADQAWQELAATYTEQTGVEVKVGCWGQKLPQNIISTLKISYFVDKLCRVLGR